MTVRILQGDCRVQMLCLDEASVDSIVTDPPYELGFMGKAWDRSGVAFDPATWAEALRVLKPGGHLLAFGSSRTYHRLATAIEDAGFEVRDQIMWIYGSGFPKGSNLKPAHEPICVARKPFKGSGKANVALWGVGELRVDACRVGDDVRAETPTSFAPLKGNRFGDPTVTERRDPLEEKTYVGRWPANVIHDGSDAVVEAFPDAPGQLADASQSDTPRAGLNAYGAMRRGRGTETSAHSANAGAVGFQMKPGTRRLDVGSAARFFYCAKASRHDRNEGLFNGQVPATEAGATMGDRERADWPARNGNHHPTVKPTELMRYLCRLVTPPEGLILDPFMGSGSTMKAAELEGFHGIGIELDAAYIEIARRRIAGDAPLFAEVA